MQFSKMMIVVLTIAVVSIFTGLALAADPIVIGGQVWNDSNGDGEIDSYSDEVGIDDVMVVFWRDYDCNGVVDGADAIYDYDFTEDDDSGNPGFYSIQAYGGWCFLLEIDGDTLPPDSFLTTPGTVFVQTADEDVLDINFGVMNYDLGYHLMGGRVWQDENDNGRIDGDEEGIEGVQILFYRDYECNGIVDPGDELFDYAFSDIDGNYTVANAKYCYVAFPEALTVPGNTYYTTAEAFAVAINGADVLNLNFGLNYKKDEPGFVCPQRASFWAYQFKGKRHATFSNSEMKKIVRKALTMTRVFRNESDLKDALKYRSSRHHHCHMEMKVDKHFAALVLNLAAFEVRDDLDHPVGFGFDTPLDLPEWTEATTVGEAFEQIEDAILHHGDLHMAKRLSKALTRGEGMEVTCH